MRAPQIVAVGTAVLVLGAVSMAAATGVVSASLLGGGGAAGGVGSDLVATSAAIGGIPAGMLRLYQEAAATCPGLPWTVLAAIGTVESGNGTSNLPGVHSGANAAGAEGPMQFEPATFAAYDEPVPPGGVSPPTPYDPADAVYAAAKMLCANGASDGANVSAAIFSYNHSATYVAQVLSLAQRYGAVADPASVATSAGGVAAGGVVPGGVTAVGVPVGGVALAWALAQVGTPYIWGGETPGVGFDCSGLVQAAYRVAGLSLPRVAQDQFDAGPALPPGTTLEPGDLVFFGSGPDAVAHVGLYAGIADGRAMMVDAPHSGAAVRIDAFPTTLGASWGGSEDFVGATRPGG